MQKSWTKTQMDGIYKNKTGLKLSGINENFRLQFSYEYKNWKYLTLINWKFENIDLVVVAMKKKNLHKINHRICTKHLQKLLKKQKQKTQRIKETTKQ